MYMSRYESQHNLFAKNWYGIEIKMARANLELLTSESSVL